MLAIEKVARKSTLATVRVNLTLRARNSFIFGSLWRSLSIHKVELTKLTLGVERNSLEVKDLRCWLLSNETGEYLETALKSARDIGARPSRPPPRVVDRLLPGRIHLQTRRSAIVDLPRQARLVG